MSLEMEKIWRPSPVSLKLQAWLSGELKILALTARVLINRGVDSPEGGRIFLNPSLKDIPNPLLLPDMEKAVGRIVQAIVKKELIAVYGDYDVDGIASTAMLSLFFKELGVTVRTHIPDRIREGYGLQAGVLEKLKSEGVSLVITADCGTKSHQALTRAKEIGLDAIVTDHHELDGSRPPAFAFINPHANPDQRGKELAGCGVAFFLLIALRQKLREEKLFPNGEPNLRRHLDLVALATIADLAPLTGINRILVSLGLKELTRTKKPGLIALKEVAGLKDGKELVSADVGFRLGPRINAGGRIAQANLGLNLLCEQYPERARGLAKILDQCNRDRQALQEKHLQEAMEQAEAKQGQKGLVVFSKNWHPGIVGLVASRLTEHFYRPAIAFSLEGELARGSARSIPGIHIVEVLQALAGRIEQFGGHAAAAGLTVHQNRLQDFAEAFARHLEANTHGEIFTPAFDYDGIVTLAEINGPLLGELEMLRPFGMGNPEPVFAAEAVTFNNPRVVGKNHLRLELGEGRALFPAIAFAMKGRLPLKSPRGRALFTPQWNEYQGTKTIQFKIKDLKDS